jgi:hypothetical protein
MNDMNRHRLCLIVLAVFVGGTVTARGDEPFEEFLQSLRERGYYDSALFYLEQQEKRNDLAPETRAVIPFEKAMTLLQGAKTVLDPLQQRRDLVRAEVFLNQFVKASPQHPSAAQANTERANIYLERARVDVYQADSPSNRDTRAEFQKSSLANVTKARGIFKKALDQFKTASEKFPSFIPQQDTERYEARRQAELKYLIAQKDLALTTYQQAQAYDFDSKEYQNLLTKAATEFEAIHSRYRSMPVGLYSRMMQGKCFQEQNEIGRALGIFNEILKHPGQSRSLRNIQNQVRRFRLICLNHDKKEDYQLVVDEATAWLTANRSNRSLLALGIRWERVLAREKLSNNRRLSKKDQDDLLRQARIDAEEINKFSGKYKDISTFKIQEINVALNSDQGDPKDFGTAYSIGRRNVQQIAGHKAELATAQQKNEPAARINQLTKSLADHLYETARMLGLALKNVSAKESQKQINEARYLLSYVYLLQRKNYEAAILGEYVGRRFQKQNPQLALDASYVALAAYQQEYAATPKIQRDVEMDRMQRLGALIIETWPETEKANDSRILLGNVYRDRDQPVQAARFFSGVSSASERFVEAQLYAGQAYWAAYIDAAPLDAAQWDAFLKKAGLTDGAQPSPNKDAMLNQWRDAAEKFFRAGISQQEQLFAGSPSGTNDLDDLIAAKVSLGFILVGKGEYPGVVSLLTGKPSDPKGVENSYPVLKAVAVKDEKSRPDSGITGRRFASSVYQLLLRAYVGTQQITEALSVMESLEKIAGGTDSENVTAVYVQLGQELQKEIERLKGLNQQKRLAEVRSSFDQFLGKLFDRKEKMPYNHLIWIAETYYGLGRGMGQDNKTVAETYFKQAAESYQAILNRDQQDGNFVDDSREKGVTLRLAHCRRHQGDFEIALNMIQNLLAENANFLQAQFEAAYILQDWGSSGQGDSHKKLFDAIQGQRNDDEGGIWGWGYIAIRLKREVHSGRLSPEKQAEYGEKYMEARYNVSESRRRYGLAQSSSEKKSQALKSAKQEIDTLVALNSNVSNDWKNKFDGLYREIQKDMDIADNAVAVINWPVEIVKTTSPAAKSTNSVGRSSSTKKVKRVAVTESSALEESSSTAVIVGVVMSLVCLGGFGWFLYSMMGRNKKRRPDYVTAGVGNLSELPTFQASTGKQFASSKVRGSQSARSVKSKAASQSPKTSKVRKATPKRRPSKPSD